MKYFIDGDQVVVANDDFVNLQESRTVWYPANSTNGKTIINDGIDKLPRGVLKSIRKKLRPKVAGKLDVADKPDKEHVRARKALILDTLVKHHLENTDKENKNG